MALLENNSSIRACFFAGSLDALARSLGCEAANIFGNARAFGKNTSWPQGYTQVTRALVPPLVASGQIATQQRVDVDATAALGGIGNIAAGPAIDIDLTAAGNVLLNGSALFTPDVDLTAAARSTGNLSALIDWVARPSADDIAQTVLNGFDVEAGLSVSQILRVLLSAAAGKTSISSSPSVVVRFRDQADTKDRIVGDMTGSERTSVTIDGT